MTDFDVDALMSWAEANPWPAALAVGPPAALLLGLIAYGLRAAFKAAHKRITLPVATSAFGAVLATGLSSDTAWRFAEESLGIHATWERLLIFAVGEIALFSFALAARANLHEHGATGLPGVMVWGACGVLAVPAISVSDSLPAALVRIALGPCMAAVLLHMAMGIELRQTKPKTQRTGFLAIVTGELRARTLARFGLAEANRSAQQIIRVRSAIEAARLSEKWHGTPENEHKERRKILRELQKKLLKSGIAEDPEMHELYERQRAYLQYAAGPRVLPSPWENTDPSGVKAGARLEENAAVPGLHPLQGAVGEELLNASEALEVKAGGGLQDPSPFTLHPSPEPSPQPQQPPVNGLQARPEPVLHGIQPPFTPASAPGPFSSPQEETAQVSAMNVVPEGHGHAPWETRGEGQADDMSIQPPARLTGYPEDLHPGRGPASVPFQGGPQNAPESSPEDLLNADTFHPGSGVKTSGTLHPEAPVNEGEGLNATTGGAAEDGEGAAVDGEDDETSTAGGKPTPEQAREIIEAEWWKGELTNADTARKAQRAASRVTAIWKELEEKHGRRPRPGEADGRRRRERAGASS